MVEHKGAHLVLVRALAACNIRRTRKQGLSPAPGWIPRGGRRCGRRPARDASITGVCAIPAAGVHHPIFPPTYPCRHLLLLPLTWVQALPLQPFSSTDKRLRLPTAIYEEHGKTTRPTRLRGCAFRRYLSMVMPSPLYALKDASSIHRMPLDAGPMTLGRRAHEYPPHHHHRDTYSGLPRILAAEHLASCTHCSGCRDHRFQPYPHRYSPLPARISALFHVLLPSRAGLVGTYAAALTRCSRSSVENATLHVLKNLFKTAL